MRKNAHMFVEAGFRLLPRRCAFILSTFADIIKVLFSGVCAYLSIKIMPFMARTYFTTVKWPMTVLFFPVLVGFALMTAHAIRLTWVHLRTRFVPGDSDGLAVDPTEHPTDQL